MNAPAAAWPWTRMLLATEGGEFDRGAQTLAFALARRQALRLDAILPVASNPEYEMVAPQLAAAADAQARASRAALEREAASLGVAVETIVRHGSEPYREIVEAARERASDLIVIRRRGKRGFLAQLLVGEMVSKVIAHAPCSVLVAPRAAQPWQRAVAVGIDPAAIDTALVRSAAVLAAAAGAPLHAVAVGADADAALVQGLAGIAGVELQRHRCREGRPHEQLLEVAAQAGADLIVIGRHAGGALGRAWIGGTAQKVIGLAPCAVFVHVSKETTPP